jgi:WD40 repeat protein
MVCPMAALRNCRFFLLFFLPQQQNPNQKFASTLRPREITTMFTSPTSSTDISTSLRFGNILNSSPASPSVDRFIPRRELSFSRDLSNYSSSSVEREKTRPVENDTSPAKEDYRKVLRETILSGESPRRILSVTSLSSDPNKSSDSSSLGNSSPSEPQSPNGSEGVKRKRPTRFIPKSPDKILDAPDLVDDYYLNLLDWSSTNTVAVALGQSVFLWNASTGATHKLVETTGSGNIVTSLAWASNGNSLAIGTHSAEVQLWDVESGIEIRRMRYLPAPDSLMHPAHSLWLKLLLPISPPPQNQHNAH